MDVISKELDRLQLVLSHARVFGCHYSLPVSLKTSTRATHHVAIVDRSVEREFCLTKHKLYIVTILKCRVFILFSFSLLWLKVWHVHDRILAEMLSISPNIYTAIAHHVASVDRKTVNWTWFPFKMQGVFIVIISEFNVFILFFVLH